MFILAGNFENGSCNALHAGLFDSREEADFWIDRARGGMDLVLTRFADARVVETTAELDAAVTEARQNPDYFAGWFERKFTFDGDRVSVFPNLPEDTPMPAFD
ncbi:hypothetical protein LMG28138_01801 [Pararobbsia alpina]|uniref:Uncharacterized protein n=1 Tax=Pararobbsia alpina TaxID=621374 RepID=A0A6S7B193_9BURK|nr:hypothetical protein LMG28138_01801 [Pararobbsia alpina]